MNDQKQSRKWARAAVLAIAAAVATEGRAQQESPDALVTRVSTDVLAAVHADPSIQAGDVDKVVALAETKVLPFLDFERMTATAVGPRWREATPEQKQKLQAEFEKLLVRVYSGALARARDETIALKPSREPATGNEVVVRTEVRGRGEPVELDFRVENAGDRWRIYDLNVGGVWLVENYRNSFAQAMSSGGIDGLIDAMHAKNQGGSRG